MKIPYHAIILATVLFLFGVILITLGTLILTGHIETDVCVDEIREIHIFLLFF